MRTILFFIALAFAILSPSAVSAQTTVVKDAAGNYTTAPAAPKTEAQLSEGATDSGKTYTDTKGKVFRVWLSASGKMFVIAPTKKGGFYRRYLKMAE